MSDYISEDSISQIFKWLPVKSLFRFRSVCKCWKDMIDSESFIQDHLAVQKPRLVVAYEQPEEFLVIDPHTLPLVQTLSAPIQDEAKPFRLVGTHHGVVCLYDKYTDFLLWNPTIRKLSVLPLPGTMEFGWDDNKPDAVPPYFGFWMDPSNKNFKIIVFTLAFDHARSRPVCGVLYSSTKQDWAVVPLQKLRDYTPRIQGPPVMIGEVAYWKVHYNWIDEGRERMDMLILSFDFVRERFNIIGMPHESYRGWFVIHCKLQGTLSLVYRCSEHPHRCDVYLRQEGIWVKKFVFNLSPHLYRVFWVWGEMEGRCRALASDSEGSLLLYDTKADCIELKRGHKNFPSIDMAYDYVESFIFP